MNKLAIIALIIGYITIAFSLTVLIAPKFLRKVVDLFSIGSRIYAVGLLRLILGVLFLMLATQARFWGYIIALGLACSASGLFIFFIPLRRTKKFLQRLENLSNSTLRILAAIGFAIWGLLIYSILPAIPH
ncbi:MAG: hypothetical protein JSV30_03925 [Candidatus Omnitrophota bacterium]|nr:MAG: hypothetical protein JSV30_03925 [Candidatus Omnitrophota bacterium]